MAVYEVIWRDRDDGTLYDACFDEPGLVQAGIVALAQAPDNMILVSVQEASFAGEVEYE